MTLGAPAAATGARGALAAVAALPYRSLLTGPPVAGRLLGSSRRAAWLAVGDDVLVVSACDGIRLPNGIALGIGSASRPFAGLESGDPATVGGGRIALGAVSIRPVRWWDPRPAPARTDPAAVASRIERVWPHLRRGQAAGLAHALAGGEPAEVTAAALRLLGLGPGLTPDGDDVVAGAFAALRVVGAATGSSWGPGIVDRVAPDVLAAAADRTTALSVSLLRHACRGEVAVPVGRFLEAITGRGDTSRTLDALLAVGHSSGASLAEGVVAGAAAISRRESP